MSAREDDQHHVVPPAIYEVLVSLPDHAELLLPAIRDQLDTSTDDRFLNRLCHVLAAWGPAAAAAFPQLLGLLDDDRTWGAAATALAAIGKAGNAARDLLLARCGTGAPQTQLAAWAYWKTCGEPGPLLDTLARAAAAEGHMPHPDLRKVADLGPHAAPFADRLRTLTTAPGPWTRVEAAHALWAATDDTHSTVPVLMTAVQCLHEGTYYPVMLPAVRHLTRIGCAAQPAAHLLGGVPTLEQRLRCAGGRRGFTQDEEIRTAVGRLLGSWS